MQVITTIKGMKDYSRKARQEGKVIGFVPTMGYLHDGHMSLVRAAREECDVVIVSIFLNPAQFGPDEDLDKYPRDMERDRRLLREAGVDAVFVASAGEMYPQGHSTFVEVTGRITESLCGSSRPGHFRGVTTIVAKLFNIVDPDKSYFGQKDAQQAVVIGRMAEDLDMSVEMRVMPIVREKDGLAMSSRNSYLSPGQRREALSIFRSLERAKEVVAGGERSTGRIKEEMTKILNASGDVRIDYVEIVDADSMEPLVTIKDNTLIAIAVFVGETRLIDNVVVRGAGE